ncbi:MAG: hypothetical protein J6B10_03080 [Lachnospiraceae bacterium]|nr:hypothetical protein [Lachnospiraceae bacterium]
MKRMIAVAAAVLGYIGILFYILPNFMPDLGGIVPYMETTSEGNIILAENKSFWGNLYEIDREGSIIRAYNRLQLNGKKIVGFEVVRDGRIFCITQEGSTGTNRITVSLLDRNWGSEEVLGTVEYASQLIVTSSTVVEDKLFLTALDNENWKVILYSCDLAGKEPAELKEEIQRDLPEMHKVADAAYDGTYLYILQNNGELGHFVRESYRYFPQKTEGRVLWMEVASNGLLYTTETQEQIWFLEDGKSTVSCEVSVTGLLDADSLEHGTQSAALARNADYTYSLLWNDIETSIPCSEITYRFPIVWSLIWKVVAASSILYVLFVLGIFGILRSRKSFRPVIYTMIFNVILINTLFVALLTIYIYRNSRNYLEQSRGISNKVYMIMEMYDLVSNKGISLEGVSLDNFYDTEWADTVDDTLLGVITDASGTGGIVKFQMELVYADEEKAYVLNARECVTGRSLYAYYNKELAELVAEAQENVEGAQGVCSFLGHDYFVCVVPDDVKNIYYVGKATLDDLDERSRTAWGTSLKWACIYGVASAVLMVFVLYRVMRPVKAISGYMEKVAGGIYDLPEKVFPNNEYGRMWVALHKMCKALRMQEYARGNVVKYYSRFAPREFEKLFGKEALQQVAVGDTVLVDGTVGIVSVVQKEKILQNRVMGDYIRYIKRLLEGVSACNEKSGGILLTNDNKLESIKVIYKEPEVTADKAVEFGIESLESLRTWEDGRYDTVPLILLHSGKFICGLAGTQAQTYPFVMSQELELLGTYVNRLKSIGVHVVVTGQTLQKQGERYHTRYIGFITPGQGYRFELYEVLDACTRAEKEQKMEMADAFGRAVEQYEHGMFKEAGNLLLDIVKKCPDDLAAKWYLFACEEKLNADVPAGEAAYGLFQ